MVLFQKIVNSYSAWEKDSLFTLEKEKSQKLIEATFSSVLLLNWFSLSLRVIMHASFHLKSQSDSSSAQVKTIPGAWTVFVAVW